MVHTETVTSPSFSKIASQFMRHAKRRRLAVEDFDKALKWSGIEVNMESTTELYI